ncbi:MAG: class A beta-lactamase-related serine hydrolase [Acidobacteria bacterium]|nr:MAG: class A beta-lactamase-related serine hydrolase [Acidobacteriota bacterium]
MVHALPVRASTGGRMKPLPRRSVPSRDPEMGIPRPDIRVVLLWLALFLLALLALPLRGAEPRPEAFPDTPTGKRAAAFFEAFASGGEERLAAFFSSAMGPESLKQRPAAERGRRLAAIRNETGAVKVRRVDAPSADEVVVVTQGEGSRLQKWTFAFGPAPDTYLLGIGVDEADADDLAGPPPPMAEGQALEAIEKAVSQAVVEDRFSGVVLVARDGKVLLHRAWGLASREHDVSNRPDTKFNLGSINKLFTKVAVGQLVEAGKLSLDDTIGKHLPDYPNADARKATVRQLLDMQSGIGDFFGEEFDATPKERLRKNADYLPLFAKKPLLFAPGTDRRYSNGGYVVLGEIVAKASGRDYHDTVRENVYKRAGMTDTDSYEADVVVPNMAEGYTRRWDGEDRTEGPRRKNVYTRPARGSAAGGGYSTAPDLLRFVAALLGDRLLTPPYTEWVLTRAEPVPGKPPGDRTRGGIGVAGGAPGINALLDADRGTGLVLVVLANDDPPAAEAVAKKARRLLDAIRR